MYHNTKLPPYLPLPKFLFEQTLSNTATIGYIVVRKLAITKTEKHLPKKALHLKYNAYHSPAQNPECRVELFQLLVVHGGKENGN